MFYLLYFLFHPPVSSCFILLLHPPIPSSCCSFLLLHLLPIYIGVFSPLRLRPRLLLLLLLLLLLHSLRSPPLSQLHLISFHLISQPTAQSRIRAFGLGFKFQCLCPSLSSYSTILYNHANLRVRVDRHCWPFNNAGKHAF